MNRAVRRFVRRYWPALAAASVLLGGSSLVISILYSKLKEAEADRSQALSTLREEVSMASSLREVNKVLVAALDATRVVHSSGRDTWAAKSVLDAAAAQVLRSSGLQSPTAELNLRLLLGRAYVNLNAPDDAEALMLPALDLARSLHPGDHRTTALALECLAAIARTRGRSSEADSLYRSAEDMRRRLQQPGRNAEVDPDRPVNMTEWGRLLIERGDDVGAEGLLRSALASFDSGEGQLHRSALVFSVEARIDLAGVLERRGDVLGAEGLLIDAVKAVRRSYPGDSLAVSLALGHLGRFYVRQDRSNHGEDILLEQLAMLDRLGVPDCNDRAAAHSSLFHARFRVTGFESSAGIPPWAEEDLLQAISIRRGLASTDTAALAADVCAMARLRYAMKRPDLAAAHVQEALAITDTPALRTSIARVNALAHQALLHQAMGDLPSARQFARLSMDVWMQHRTRIRETPLLDVRTLAASVPSGPADDSALAPAVARNDRHSTMN